MKHQAWREALPALLLGALLSAPAFGQVEFSDPTGDDNGDGGYVYPADPVYSAGSFDLTGLTVSTEGKSVEFAVELAAQLGDPWRMGTGFSLQMIFIFIDTDGEEGSGHTAAPPGLNVAFAAAGAWDRCVILSPQGAFRVETEVAEKVAVEMKNAIVVPERVRGSGRVISARVALDDLGGGDPAAWGYQVVVQANEGFPVDGDLLTRKVNEIQGQHHFGGGRDSDCDPHAIDVLAGDGTGEASEAAAQHEMLRYECAADGGAGKTATLKMVRRAG